MRRIVLLLALTVPLFAEPIALRAARALDVRTGAIATNAVVVVDGERIVSVGKAVPTGGSMLDAEGIRLMKEHGTYLVPTLYIAQPAAGTREGKSANIVAKGEAMSAAVNSSFRNALAAGVKIAFGTDSGVYPHGLNAREFAVLVRFGMKPIDAIRAATINAADLLGVSDRGTLEAGKLADVIAVPGNPLEDVTVMERVVFVMKGGEVYKP